MPPLSHSKDTFDRVSHERRIHANLNKAIRLANACRGHEKEVHIARAQKLAKRYGIKLQPIKK